MPETEKMIRLVCPNLQCRAILAVPQSARGKTVRCKHCSSRLSVPEESSKRSQSAASGQADVA